MSEILNKLETTDFEDAYLTLETFELYFRKNNNTIKDNTIEFNIEELKNIGLYDENKDSYYFENNGIAYRVAIAQSAITLRKVGTELDFFFNFYNNFYLLDFLNLTLKNGSLLISGATGSGKTTFIQSLLNFFNEKEELDLIKVLLYKVLLNYDSFNEKNRENFLNENNEEKILTTTKNIIGNEKEFNDTFSNLKNYFKNTNITNFLKLFQNKVVYTIERPLEMKFKNNKTLFIQNDIPSSENSEKEYLRKVEVSLQSNPDLLYISEIKSSSEYTNFTKIIQQGAKVIASNHSDNVFQNLVRILSEANGNNDTIKERLSSGLSGLLNIKRYETNDDSFLVSYEMLDLTNPDVKNNLKNENIEKMSTVIRNAHSRDKVYFSHNESLFLELQQRFKNDKPVLIKNWTYNDYEDFFKSVEGSVGENTILTDYYNIQLDDVVKFKEDFFSYYNEKNEE